MSYLTIDPDTGQRRSLIRWPDGMRRPLDGCRWCGHVQSTHSLFWMPARPGHAFEPPTAAQRAARAAANARIDGRRVEQIPAPRHAARPSLPPGVDTGVLQRVVEGLRAL
ncbi:MULTISPECIES: hypothetical protein [unclassified Microbispora]|uniref:hypothetical protein n=1 Tax=unclassified Microbispora TaxID=2614687 RepID=UPI00143922CC|nr:MULTISPECIES: hypothetical protein [unclassified Microbispora]NJP27071.1 hypothetical protein [Microbispora sp. CL1-1]